MRLLQNFSTISLASGAQPLDSRPPADWAEDKVGRKGREKIRPRAHLSMYVQVCVVFDILFSFLPELWSVVNSFNHFCFIGRALGYNAGGKAW